MRRTIKSLCHTWCLWLSSISELRCLGWLWDLYSTSIFESSVPQEITARLCWQLSEVTFSVKLHTVIFFISNHPLKLSYQLSAVPRNGQRTKSNNEKERMRTRDKMDRMNSEGKQEKWRESWRWKDASFSFTPICFWMPFRSRAR